MLDSDDSVPSHGAVLAATVFAATASAGLSSALLPALLDPLGVSGVILVDATSPFLHALLPLAFVYVACKRVGGVVLSTWAVAGISLPTAILGRYLGTGVGYVLRGGGPPTPLVLVSAGDLAAREFGVVLWTATALGVLGAGLWGAVGALGGVGAIRHAPGPE